MISYDALLFLEPSASEMLDPTKTGGDCLGLKSFLTSISLPNWS